MPRTDTDPLGDRFMWRLRTELNRLQPPYSPPRYRTSRANHRVGTWRFAPAGLVAGVIGIAGLSAFAATGSPNPVVWTQQIVTKIESNAAPESTPSSTAPGQPPSPYQAPPAAAPPAQRPQPTPRAQPTEGPESTPSPVRDGGGDDDHHGSRSATASSTRYGGDH